jgi:hypothetical protein
VAAKGDSPEAETMRELAAVFDAARREMARM